MLNIEQLEKKWIRYKLKFYTPHAILLISLCTIITIVSIFLFQKKEITEQSIEVVTLEEAPEEKLSTPMQELLSTNITPITQKDDTTKRVELSPSFSFLSNLQKAKEVNLEEKVVQTQATPPKQTPIEPPKKELKESIENIIIPVETKNLTIERQNTQEDINHVLKRFAKSNNPVLSLFVAKKYYELGEYEKAYNYALITNEIDSDIEASWILFAKSLVKLQRKDKAIETLKTYIKHTNSNQAKILLEEIIGGKFK